jgi:hypothetical protein
MSSWWFLIGIRLHELPKKKILLKWWFECWNNWKNAFICQSNHVIQTPLTYIELELVSNSNSIPKLTLALQENLNRATIYICGWPDASASQAKPLASLFFFFMEDLLNWHSLMTLLFVIIIAVLRSLRWGSSHVALVKKTEVWST